MRDRAIARRRRFAGIALGLLAILVRSGLIPASGEQPPTAKSPVVMGGFDDEASLAAWQRDPGVNVKLTTEHGTHRTTAAKLTIPASGRGISLETLAPTDWSGFTSVEADLFNTEQRELKVSVRLQDANGRTATHTQLASALSPAWLIFRLAEAEPTLDLRRMSRLWLGVLAGQSEATLFVENLRLIPKSKVAKVAPKGETVIEAEDFIRGTATIDSDSWGRGSSPVIIDPWVSGAKGPGGLEYDIEFVATGRYLLSCKYACRESRQVMLFFDGALFDDKALRGTTGSYAGITARWDPVAVLPVGAGRHTLKVMPCGSYPHIDAFKFAFTHEPVCAPSLVKRPERIAHGLRRAQVAVQALPAARGAQLSRCLSRAIADWNAAWRRGEDLVQLAGGLREFERRWAPLYCETLPLRTAHAFGVKPDRLHYAVGVESPARKVFWSVTDFEGEVGVPARVSLARGEYEGVQLAVLAGNQALRGVRVSVSDLLGPGDGRLPADEVEIHPVGYVESTGHPERDEQTGEWWPDPLLANAPFGVAPSHVQPVWFTVHAPVSARPGDYGGVITIAPEGSPPIRVPLLVKVWNFAVPPENHLKTSFVVWWGRDAVSRQEFEQWAEFLLEHRIGFWGAFGPIRKTETGCDYSEVDKDLKFCSERHMNSMCFSDFTAGPYSQEREVELRRSIADYARHLKERGWFDKAYLKLHDEPQPSLFPAVRAQAELVKAIDPGIKRLCTVRIVPELIGAVDIWMPCTPDYDVNAAAAARARGEDVWTYTCGGPAPPAPNIAYIRQEALGHRLLPWQCFNLGASGYLYWSVKQWPDSNTTQTDHNWSVWRWAEGAKVKFVPAQEAGKGWPAIPWIAGLPGLPIGDGYVTYPGPRGEPLSSLWLEAFRDGIEDVEYLFLLRERARAARKAGQLAKATRAERLLAQASALVSPQGEYDSDPSRLTALREGIGKELSRN